MRISQHPHPRYLRTPFLAPHATKSEEKSLLRRVAVDLLSFLASLVVGNHVFQGRQRNARAAVIGSVFSQRKPAIELQIIDRNEVRILICHTAHSLFEFLSVLLGPPIVKISLRIELPPLIVEAVG